MTKGLNVVVTRVMYSGNHQAVNLCEIREGHLVARFIDVTVTNTAICKRCKGLEIVGKPCKCAPAIKSSLTWGKGASVGNEIA